MKKLLMILPLALILCFMVGCQDKEAMAELEAMKAQAEVEEQNKKIMIRWIEELDKGNFDVFDELCSDDYLNHYPGSSEPMTREAYKQSVHSFISAFPDFTHTIEDVIAEGDKALVRVTMTGTHRGDSIGIPPHRKRSQI